MLPTGVDKGIPTTATQPCAVADDEGSMSVGLDAGRDVACGFEPQEFDAAGYRALLRQFQALCGACRCEENGERDELAHGGHGSCTFARRRPCASRASMIVPAGASSALRKIWPCSSLTMA